MCLAYIWAHVCLSIPVWHANMVIKHWGIGHSQKQMTHHLPNIRSSSILPIVFSQRNKLISPPTTNSLCWQWGQKTQLTPPKEEAKNVSRCIVKAEKRKKRTLRMTAAWRLSSVDVLILKRCYSGQAMEERK